MSDTATANVSLCKKCGMPLIGWPSVQRAGGTYHAECVQLTPKEQYEARKAERKAQRQKPYGGYPSAPDPEIEELFDRFVTAVERIADALEAKAQ